MENVALYKHLGFYDDCSIVSPSPVLLRPAQGSQGGGFILGTSSLTFSPISTDAGAPPARCWVARIGSVLVLEGPRPLPLPASNSDCVPEGMCVPALGPVPAPEVTPAGSRLVPIFPLHVAPWLVSNCVRSLGTQNLGCSPARPHPAQLGVAQPSTQWRPRAGGGTSVRAFICLSSIYSLTLVLFSPPNTPGGGHSDCTCFTGGEAIGLRMHSKSGSVCLRGSSCHT